MIIIIKGRTLVLPFFIFIILIFYYFIFSSMIKFNELRITPDNECLIIDVQVSQESYYKDIYLDSIIIDNQDSYNPNGPSDNPIYSITSLTQNNNYIYSSEDLNNYIKDSDQSPVFDEEDTFIKKKKVRIILTKQDIGKIEGNMFFVYVIAGGTPSPNTPCGMDNSICMRTVIALQPIYNKAIQYFKELNTECTIPKGLIDIILRLKALELSIKTGNYNQAISYWNKYFINLQGITEFKTNNYGCCN